MTFDELLTKLSPVGVVLAGPEENGDSSGITTAPTNPLTGRFDNLGSIFIAIVNVVFYVGIAMTVIFLIIGGIRYITSGGSKEGAEAARGMITNAIIGFIVVLGAFAIKSILLNLLGAEIAEPGAWWGTWL